MSEYTPDTWVMVKFKFENDTVYKILAGWGGSYLYGASWKLNSGVTKIEEDGQCYLFYGSSGSVYRCRKNCYGLSGYTAGILSSFEKKFEKYPPEVASIELMPEETNFMEIDYGTE